MPTLPNLSGKAAMKAFQRGGWTKVRQRGSHVVMVKDGSMAPQGGTKLGALWASEGTVVVTASPSD